MPAKTKESPNGLGPVSNDAEDQIVATAPVLVNVQLTGTSPMLFHRYSVEAVAEKATAAKGSAGKKTDDTESYVYRDEDGDICLPGEYIRQSVIMAGKFRQDPRSPRKSMFDLLKAAVIPMTHLAKLNGGVKDWDSLDQRRVMVQRNAITRQRPCFNTGWYCDMEFQLIIPEYVNAPLFLDLLGQAGRVIGTADFRPTYGRYAVTSFSVVNFTD